MNDKLLLKLYYNMLKIRRVELEIAKKYSENQMRCPTHLSIGQEAVSAAYSAIISIKDYAVSTHRGHAHYLAKGGDLKALIAELYGRRDGCSKGKGGSMHLIDLKANFMGTSAIVGNSIPIGVGLGMSQKLLRKKNITTIFIGEGATEEGIFFESINFAIVKKLPILFICENNLYSVYSSLKERQPKDRKIYKMVKSLGSASSICDGNDIIKCYNSIYKAYDYVKKQSKPFFIECKTYRYLEHCGPFNDDHLSYRPLKETKYWKSKDPLFMFNKIIKKNFSKKKIDSIKLKVIDEVNRSFEFAINSKFASSKEAFQGNYAKK